MYCIEFFEILKKLKNLVENKKEITERVIGGNLWKLQAGYY